MDSGANFRDKNDQPAKPTRSQPGGPFLRCSHMPRRMRRYRKNLNERGPGLNKANPASVPNGGSCGPLRHSPGIKMERLKKPGN